MGADPPQGLYGFAIFAQVAVLPTAGNAGFVYMRTTDKAVYYDTGTALVLVSPGSSGLLGTANTWTATQTFQNIAASADNTYNIGTATNRFATASSVQFNVFGSSGDANPTLQLSSGQFSLGAGGATAVDVALTRSTASLFSSNAGFIFTGASTPTASQAGIGADSAPGSPGNVILNAPTGKSVLCTVNGSTVLTIGATITLGATLALNGQTLSGSVTASGAWTFSGAGTAISVTNNATISGTATITTLSATTINGAALSGTFTGTPTFSGTVAFTATSPFSVANGQTLTVSVTAQTVGAATLTIPNFAGADDTFTFITLAQTLSNKTLSSPTISGTLAGSFSMSTATLTHTVAFTEALASNTAAADQFTDGTNAYYTIDTRTTTDNIVSHKFSTTNPTIAGVAGSSYSVVNVAAVTFTTSSTTTITALNGLALNVSAPTINQSGGAVTVTTASSLYISGAPAAGASVTITNAYALNVAAGVSNFAGNVQTSALYISSSTTATGDAFTNLTLNKNKLIAAQNNDFQIITTSDGAAARKLLLQVQNAVTQGNSRNITVLQFNAGAASGSNGLLSNETIYFGANATGFAYAAQAALTADASAGNLILNAPTGKLIGAGLNGVQTVAFGSKVVNVYHTNFADTNASATLGDGSISLGAGGATALDVILTRNAVNQLASTNALTLAGVSNTASALVFSDGTNGYLTIDTRTTNAGSTANLFSATGPTIASAAGVQYFVVGVGAVTVTLTGTTTVNSMVGTALNINAPTITDASAVTVSSASTVYISGAPIAGGSVTITNAYALYVNGTVNITGITTLGANVNVGGNSLFNAGKIGLGSNNADTIAGALTGSRTAALAVVGAADGTTARQVLLETQNAVTGGTGNSVNRIRIYAGSALGSGTVQVNDPLQIGGTDGTAATANQIWTATQGASSTQLFIGNASINVTSDARLKEQIQPATINGLELLSKLEVVSFRWKDYAGMGTLNDRGLWQAGLIAQQVAPYIPWLVNAPDAEQFTATSKQVSGMWQIEFAYMVPLLVKAIQELAAQIRELRISRT